jgi:hypothetical protein
VLAKDTYEKQDPTARTEFELFQILLALQSLGHLVVRKKNVARKSLGRPHNIYHRFSYSNRCGYIHIEGQENNVTCEPGTWCNLLWSIFGVVYFCHFHRTQASVALKMAGKVA